MTTSQKPVYIYSDELLKQCDKLPTMQRRATMVQDLIESYRTLISDCTVVRSKKATEEDLKLFHSTDFVDFIKNVNESCEEGGQLEAFGLLYDCPVVEDIFDFVCEVAGGSITAAKVLATGYAKVVLNWFGGWHHAQRDSAEGFCYINDIVLAIHMLSKKFNKVMYVDLDVHHGNGVQNAFELCHHVLTLSIHKQSAGFYPGSGSIDEVGCGKGKYYTINVPLAEGIGNATYKAVFDAVFKKAYNSFKPDAMVIQCGADIISGDPIGQCNVTFDTMGECVKQILRCNIPTMFLGGGGYNFANTARYWTYLTSVILKQDLDENIPDESNFFTKYGPTFELAVDTRNMKDCNTKQAVADLIGKVESICDEVVNIEEYLANK